MVATSRGSCGSHRQMRPNPSIAIRVKHHAAGVNAHSRTKVRSSEPMEHAKVSFLIDRYWQASLGRPTSAQGRVCPFNRRYWLADLLLVADHRWSSAAMRPLTDSGTSCLAYADRP